MNLEKIKYFKIWYLLNNAQKKRAVSILVMMVFGMFLEILGIGLIIPSIALLTQESYLYKYPELQSILSFFGNPSHNMLMVSGVILLAVVYLFKNAFLAITAWVQYGFVFGMMENLSNRLFNIYLKQPYEFHLQRNSSLLIRNVFNEVDLFTTSVMTPSMLLLSESFVLAGLSVLVFVVEPVGALTVVLVVGLVSFAFSRLTSPFVRKWGENRQYHAGYRVKHIQQGLGGIKDIIISGQEEEFLNKFNHHNVEYARVGRKQNTLLQLPRMWLEVLVVFGLVIFVINMVLQGEQVEAIMPTLGLFAAVAFRLMPSANRLLGAVQSLKYGATVIETLNEELGLSKDHAIGKVSAIDAVEFASNIELSRISYAYPEASVRSLHSVSISMKRGETIGIIGPSGAGKSTLVDIILGLLQPESGEILVDGENIAESTRGWQALIGYVPQSIFLTDESIKNNIAFGLPECEIDEDMVWKALRAAQLEDYVNDLPEGIDTIVGERGVKLSGGQRQRIGIARALYNDPPVLVLDEATSALDTETEEGIMNSIHLLQGKKTIIIVAHRLSTVKICDQLYQLDGGCVIQQGTYSEIFGK